MKSTCCAVLLGFGVVGLWANAAVGQGSPAPSKSCQVRHVAPSAADIAGTNRQIEKAIALYAEESKASGPEGERARAGMIRWELQGNKLQDASKAATEWSAQQPNNPWMLAALSEVQLAQGNLKDAGASIQKAFQLDPCNSWVRDEYGRLLMISGMNASAKQQMDSAHAFDPDDPEIFIHWLTMQPRAVQVSEGERYLSQSTFLTENMRKQMETWVERRKTPVENSCKLVGTFSPVSLPYRAIQNGPTADAFWGLEVRLNGELRRMEISTGSQEMVLTPNTAAGLHLQPDASTKPGAAYFATVKSIRIGNLEFVNCRVKVVAGGNYQSADGWLGTDIFDQYLLTLDYPGRMMKLDRLPAIPGVADNVPDGLKDGSVDFSDEPVRDRYVDPSMKDWTRVYRLGYDLFLPTRVDELKGKSSQGLFLISTGAEWDFISMALADNTEYLTRADSSDITGTRVHTNARPRKVVKTGPADLYFGNIKQRLQGGLTGTRLENQGAQTIGMYGVLGGESLNMMTVSFDYRDGLVNFQYDPKRVPHCDVSVNMPGCY